MSIENTSDRPGELHMLGMLSDGQSDYITGMEAAGQRQLVASTALPTGTSEGDEPYLALGFTFGAAFTDDRLFRPATLPEGWRKEGSDHAMWSYVVDQLGRRRVGVFYKAAFYDRRADMRLETVCSYARTLAYDGSMPVYDDTWCTREAFAEQVAALRDELAERVEMAIEMTAQRDDEYWSRRARELGVELVQHDVWASKVAADG